jgi:iron complex transport system permease protein
MVLGITGTIMQGVLRNPVASPFTLGLSSAAGFGASLSIILGLNLIWGEYAIIGNAFVFSLLNAAFVISMTIRKKSKPETLILAGVAMHYLFTALTTLIQYFGKEEAVKAAMFWSVGDLGKANWSEITLVLILTILCLPILLSKSSELNIMRAGDEAAISLGVNVERTRKILLVISSFIIAITVSFTGAIGFIGLVAPHLCRMVIGGDNRFLLPASGLLGASLLVLADTVARTVLSPVLLPVGVMTSFIGVPMFLYLIIKQNGDI